MLLNLLKEAVYEARYSNNKKQTIQVLEKTVGRKKARLIVEGYQVGPDDYTKWLDVIMGYARDENIPLRSKAAFQDVAYAVLENDPAPIDHDIQDAVVNTLWANFKAQQQHSKVEKVTRAKEEEEQLHYALNKMRRGREEEESGFSQLYKRSQGIEDEEDSYAKRREKARTTYTQQGIGLFFDDDYPENEADFGRDDGPDKAEYKYKSRWGQENEEYNGAPDEFDPREVFGRSRGVENEEYDDIENDRYDMDDDYDSPDDSGQSAKKQYRPFDDEDEWDGEEGGDFEDPRDTDLRDEDIIQKASQLRRGRDLEDYDFASDEGMDQDREIIRKSKFQPKAYYANATESEEQVQYSSPFSKGQLVSTKDGSTHKVEIPDGPGDMVGIMVNGRIKMVPSKDIETLHADEEEETNTQPSKVSFLSDVLTGTNSMQNMKKLQDEIENQGANAHVLHFGKSPKNPHEPGSIAYKAWQKGFSSAGRDLWAPKKIETTTKPKPKKKK